MRLSGLFLFLWVLVWSSWAGTSSNLFLSGVEFYGRGDFARAAQAFSESARQRPASGSFENLGEKDEPVGKPRPDLV